MSAALNNLDLNGARQSTKTEGELMKLVARYVVGEMLPNLFLDRLLICPTDRGGEWPSNDEYWKLRA